MSAARRLSCRSQALGLSQFSFDEIGTVPFAPCARLGLSLRAVHGLGKWLATTWKTTCPFRRQALLADARTSYSAQHPFRRRHAQNPRRQDARRSPSATNPIFRFFFFPKIKGYRKTEKTGANRTPRQDARRRRGRRRLPPANIEESRGSPRQSPPSPLGSRDFAVPLAHCRRRADNRPNKRYT